MYDINKKNNQFNNFMHYYKATIQYDGTGYAGFQWQKDIPTIQNDLNLALMKIIDGKVTTMGASRTDTGVHALKQVVKITSKNSIECSSMTSSLNTILPSQIRCMEIFPCDGNFKPASDHLTKEYHYYFTNKKILTTDDRRFISDYSLPLDFTLMHNCAKEILDTHNFHNFYSTGSNVKSTERNIAVCELRKINPHTIFSGSKIFVISQDIAECYQFKIEGNGFLKQMVRHLVSALWAVGSGKLSIEEFSNLLNGPKCEKQLWKVAPANGLFLYKINYPLHKISQ